MKDGKFNLRHCFLLCFLMNYRDFSVKLKPILSLFQTMRIQLGFSLFGDYFFSPLFYVLLAKSLAQKV